MSESTDKLQQIVFSITQGKWESEYANYYEEDKGDVQPLHTGPCGIKVEDEVLECVQEHIYLGQNSEGPVHAKIYQMKNRDVGNVHNNVNANSNINDVSVLENPSYLYLLRN